MDFVISLLVLFAAACKERSQVCVEPNGFLCSLRCGQQQSDSGTHLVVFLIG